MNSPNVGDFRAAEDPRGPGAAFAMRLHEWHQLLELLCLIATRRRTELERDDAASQLEQAVELGGLADLHRDAQRERLNRPGDRGGRVRRLHRLESNLEPGPLDRRVLHGAEAARDRKQTEGGVRAALQE